MAGRDLTFPWENSGALSCQDRNTMADKVKIDPEQFAKGARSMGSAADGLSAWGGGLAGSLGRIAAALGGGKVRESFLVDNQGQQLIDNTTEAGGTILPGNYSAVHKAMDDAVTEFDNAESASTRSLGQG